MRKTHAQAEALEDIPEKKSRIASPTSNRHDFSLLPTDVLQLIFTHLPLYVRLHIVNRVCQRWQTEARLSIKKMRKGWNPVIALRRFPALESIFLTTSLPEQTLLPLNLQEVTVITSRSCYC